MKYPLDPEDTTDVQNVKSALNRLANKGITPVTSKLILLVNKDSSLVGYSEIHGLPVVTTYDVDITSIAIPVGDL